jgi:hypothetical protein
MVAFEPEGTGTALGPALAFLGRVLRRRAILFVISDWLDRDFDRALIHLGRRHELVSLEVTDPLESTIPPSGLVWARDLETGRPAWINLGGKRARNEWRAARARRARWLSDTLLRARAGRITIPSDTSAAPALIRHFEARARRR